MANVNVAAVANLLFKQLHFLNSNDEEELLALKKASVMLLAKGKILFTTETISKEYVAPQILYVNAFVKHTVKALSDNTVLYTVLPINVENEFVDYNNSVKTFELLNILNEITCKNESN